MKTGRRGFFGFLGAAVAAGAVAAKAEPVPIAKPLAPKYGMGDYDPTRFMILPRECVTTTNMMAFNVPSGTFKNLIIDSSYGRDRK